MAKDISIRLVGEIPIKYNDRVVGTAIVIRGDLIDLYLNDLEVEKLIRGNIGSFSLCFTSKEATKKED